MGDIREGKVGGDVRSWYYAFIVDDIDRILGIPRCMANAARMAWAPVSERLPEGEDKELVLLARRGSNGKGLFFDLGYYLNGAFRHACDDCFYYDAHIDDVTHWMPLPLLPEVAED